MIWLAFLTVCIVRSLESYSYLWHCQILTCVFIPSNLLDIDVVCSCTNDHIFVKLPLAGWIKYYELTLINWSFFLLPMCVRTYVDFFGNAAAIEKVTDDFFHWIFTRKHSISSMINWSSMTQPIREDCKICQDVFTSLSVFKINFIHIRYLIAHVSALLE